MMTLITGFTCPLTIYFKFLIIKSEVLLQSPTAFFITKCDALLLQSAPAFLLQSFLLQVLLQSPTGITKCDNFITKCDDYYKVRQYMGRVHI